MNILITGGSGYIGSQFMRRLEWYDHKVFNIDRKIGLDIIDIHEQVDEMIKDMDIVFHLAGYALDKQPAEETIYNNCVTSLIVAKACQKYNKPVVFASSCSIYGARPEIVYEGSKPEPQSPYACSKVISEGIFRHLCSKAYVLRQGTVSGVSPNMRWDLVINSMVKASKTGKIMVNGTGNVMRPMLHIDDLIDVYIDIIGGAMVPGIYNIFSQNASVMSMAQAVETLCGGKITFNSKVQDFRNYQADKHKVSQIYHKAHGWRSITEVIEDVKQLVYKTSKG